MTWKPMEDYAHLARQYDEDGVVCLRGALDDEQLAMVLETFEYTLAHPGPAQRNFYAERGVQFYQDGGNVATWPVYLDFCKTSIIPDIVGALWGDPKVWFFYEQIFLKEGMASRRTAWHQDQSYIPYEGSKTASVWINFDPVSAENTLEFVRGSHKGPIFNGSRYDADDDTAGFYADGILPPLPDIEANREAYDIISWAVEPGDIVVFHHNILHGGAPLKPGNRRRTSSLRFIGDDCYRIERTMEIAQEALSANVDDEVVRAFTGMVTALEPGQPLTASPGLVQVRP